LGRTEMSQRELSRVGILARVKSRQLRVVDAAALMGVSYRQAKRLWKRYRAVYTVRFACGVFVLPVFQKKSKWGIATPKADLDVIEARLKAAEKFARELER
jgi:phage-related protein